MGPQWLEDSSTFNEWMSEEDYEAKQVSSVLVSGSTVWNCFSIQDVHVFGQNTQVQYSRLFSKI